MRRDLEYVAKFTRQQRCNHDNSINQMVIRIREKSLSFQPPLSFRSNHFDGERALASTVCTFSTGTDMLCVCVCVCVADIQFEDIEDYMWRSGMAYNHGIDKKGNNIGM